MALLSDGEIEELLQNREAESDKQQTAVDGEAERFLQTISNKPDEGTPHASSESPSVHLPPDQPSEPPCLPIVRRRPNLVPFVHITLPSLLSATPATTTASPIQSKPPVSLHSGHKPASSPRPPSKPTLKHSLTPSERKRFILLKSGRLSVPTLRIDPLCRIPHPLRQAMFESFLELFLQVHPGGMDQCVQLATHLESKIISEAIDQGTYKNLAIAKCRQLQKYPHR